MTLTTTLPSLRFPALALLLIAACGESSSAADAGAADDPAALAERLIAAELEAQQNFCTCSGADCEDPDTVALMQCTHAEYRTHAAENVPKLREWLERAQAKLDCYAASADCDVDTALDCAEAAADVQRVAQTEALALAQYECLSVAFPD